MFPKFHEIQLRSVDVHEPQNSGDLEKPNLSEPTKEASNSRRLHLSIMSAKLSGVHSHRLTLALSI